MMSKRSRIITALVLAAITGAAVAAVASGSGTAASRLPSLAAQTKAAQAPVSQAFPGGAATLLAVPGGEGSILTVSIARASLHQPASSQEGFAVPSPVVRADSFEAGEAGWRVGMAAAYAASANPAILGWSITPSEASMSAEASNYLHGPLRVVSEATIGWPSATKIGTVTESEAVRQLESNVSVLKSATGRTIEQSAIEVVPVSADTFGLEVDLKVASLSELAPHVGDVFLGLATGLVGEPTATVEGLAINVLDSSGERASVWMNGRDGDGSALGTSEALNPSNAHLADATFPVLDGGPGTTASVSGTSPGTRSADRGMANRPSLVAR
jgi:hypothetical protein